MSEHLSVCEFVLQYSAESKSQLDAGLGGDWAMFSIREWPGKKAVGDKAQWQPYDVSGDRKNLKAGRVYHVEANLAASEIRLQVDGAHVATARLPRPLQPGGQFGLFCIGTGEIKISDIKIATVPARAFIVMEYATPFNEIYSEVIKKACKDVGLDPIRADEMYGPGMIIRDISEQILKAQVVIADITPTNPNVFWEVGYAQALSKPLILLAEKGTKLPFDVSGLRTLFYENSIGGRTQFDEGLRRHLSAIVGRPASPTTP